MLELLESYWQELLDPKDLLLNWRKKAWDQFQALGVPHVRQEAFQYLPFKRLTFPKLAMRKSDLQIEIDRHIYPECKSSYLVFIDGFFEEKLSFCPNTLVCLPMDAAMRSYGLFLQNRIVRTLKEEKDPFMALNGAFQGRGGFLYAPPKCRVEAPIQILQIFTGEQMATPRLELYLGKLSSLQVVQTALPLSKHIFCNAAIDTVLEEGAELSFCDAQELPMDALHFQSIRATLKRDALLQLRSLTKGSAITRSSLKVQLIEENSEVLLQGLSLLQGDLQSHVHAIVEHLAPFTRSRQHFKSVLKEKSRSSFEGKIFVSPLAQKTEAYQLNNNLVLSNEASANAKPNLEVFADDVKASHGATVTQLDEEALFYLCSRGLSSFEAKSWLVKGFCKEMIDQVPIASLKKQLLQEI